MLKLKSHQFKIIYSNEQIYCTSWHLTGSSLAANNVYLPLSNRWEAMLAIAWRLIGDCWAM